MNLTAHLICILPSQTGSTKNGTWKKQALIFQTTEEYPKKLCIQFWGEKFHLDSLQLNQHYTVDFDIESREYNGKWYTELKGWHIQSKTFDSPPPTQSDSPSSPKSDLPDDVDSLPF